jgi:chaperonin GroEL
VLGTLVVNKLRGALNVCAVKAPAFGDRKKQIMQDIATVTGGTFITSEIGMKLEDVTMDMLGIAEKVIVGKDNTTIINGAGSAEDIAERITQIKTQMDDSTSDYEKEKMQERLAKLAGGVAVLYIGAGSEVEMKEKKDRVDDALQATRAAIQEGVVEGGGIALLRTVKALTKFLDNTDLSPEEEDGVDVIAAALKSPITQILLNAGQNPSDIITSLHTHWSVEGGDSLGYNARTEEFVDMFADGVIDPKKVTRAAIQNASSVVGMILTTECMVVDEPIEVPTQPHMPMM